MAEDDFTTPERRFVPDPTHQELIEWLGGFVSLAPKQLQKLNLQAEAGDPKGLFRQLAAVYKEQHLDQETLESRQAFAFRVQELINTLE